MRGTAIAQFNLGAHGDQEVALGLNVANVRDIFQNDGLIGEDGGSHGREGGILCAADADAAQQGIAATYYKLVHKTFWRNGQFFEIDPNGPTARGRFLELSKWGQNQVGAG